MNFLLDTDVFSVMTRDGSVELRERLAGRSLADMALSAVTVGEIEFGLARNPLGAAAMARIMRYRSMLAVLAVDHTVAVCYGRLRDTLRRVGTPIGPNDLWIAAQALALDLTLVTGNEREFAQIPTLRVENWMR